MSRAVQDYYPLLKAAIAEAKAAGLAAAATELEEKVFAAYTTSSELLGEHKIAIQAFLRSEGSAVSPRVKPGLDIIGTDVRRALVRLILNLAETA